MAVSITDRRNLIDAADATTGWTGTATLQLYTTDPAPVETTGSIGMAVSTSTDDVYHTHGSGINFSTNPGLIYVWVLPLGTMDSTTNGGVAIQVGDGTNRIGYHLAGSDEAGFRHSSGPVGWQCLVLDSANPPSSFTAYAGSEASLNWGSITQFGAGFKTLSKALGGTENCFVDIIKYTDPSTNTDDVVVGGGTSGYGNAGQFSEIATADRANTAAYGICHELGSGLYGLQSPITIGTVAGVASSYFEDRNTTVVFEDRSIGTSYYFINISGNSVGTNSFILGQTAGGTSGKDGCNLICPTGVGASFDASNSNIDVMSIYGSNISGFENGVTFGSDTSHLVYNTAFSGCGQIDPGSILFKNNSITASTDSATGGILLDATGNSNWADLSFTSGGTGHAIYITATGTYTFTNYTYSGYSSVTVFGFDTTSDVNATTDVVTETGHGYATEDPIHYMKQGGTANMGLTDATTYYVRAVSVDTIAFYTSAANAASDTSRIALTSTGAETHYINPINASVYNNSGGAVTINVVGGDSPTVRNGSSATTTVNNSVTVEVNGVVQNTQCYIVPSAGGTAIMNEAASETVSGDEYKATESYNLVGTVDVDVKAREMGYLPFEASGTITSSGLTVTAVWLVDPNWKLVVSGENISFTNPTTITRTNATFVTEGWINVMSQVTVEGSAANDGTYTISAVAASTLTISGDTVTTAGAAAGITLTFTRRTPTW